MIVEQGTTSKITNIPIMKYFVESYARNAGLSDKSASILFTEHEPIPKVRKLRNELSLIREGRVSDKVLKAVFGIRREELHESYETWASRLLAWMK